MALVSGTANAPVLPAGWTPVNHAGTNHDFSAASSAAQGSSGWKWNYDPSSNLNGVTPKQWANAKDTKGNLWVWVPRFTYRATEFADDPEIKIRFSSDTTDDFNAIDGRTTKKHNAFTFGSVELTGIWVPKYAAHKDIDNDDIPGFKPDKTAWTTIIVNDIFNECLALKNHLTSSPVVEGSFHMLKNIEWGAAGMLGKAVGQSRPKINGDKNYKTGYTTNGQVSQDGSLDTTGETSTTGNVTGIFDMVGNTYEYVASYVNNGNANLDTYCASLVAADAKYKDVFPEGVSDGQATNYVAAAGMTDGMLIHETSTAGSGSTSWKNWNNTAANSNFPYSSGPVFHRGGNGGSGDAGLCYFSNRAGGAYSHDGFRACFVNLNSDPLISGSDQDLGSKNAPFSHVYQVSDPDGDSVDVVEKLDGNTLRTMNDASQDTDLTLTITPEMWLNLTLAQHTITIEATDDKGATNIRTITFTKVNELPTITGQDENLGNVNAPFARVYQVDDADVGNTLTITERVDSTTIRTVNDAVRNQDYTMSLAATWPSVSLGQHTATVTVTDGMGGSATRTYTFIKTEDKGEFFLKNPAQTSIAAKRLTTSGIITIPEGRTLQVFACNNAFDNEPAWEEITEAYENKQAHIFQNDYKTAENWGIQLRFFSEREASAVDIVINGFGFSFD